MKTHTDDVQAPTFGEDEPGLDEYRKLLAQAHSDYEGLHGLYLKFYQQAKRLQARVNELEAGEPQQACEVCGATNATEVLNGNRVCTDAVACMEREPTSK